MAAAVPEGAASESFVALFAVETAAPVVALAALPVVEVVSVGAEPFVGVVSVGVITTAVAPTAAARVTLIGTVISVLAAAV